MRKFQFTLRHVLIILPIVAVFLLLVRFALRSTGLAAGLMVAGIGACWFVVANVVVFVILRVIGSLSADTPEPIPDRGSKRVSTVESLSQ